MPMPDLVPINTTVTFRGRVGRIEGYTLEDDGVTYNILGIATDGGADHILVRGFDLEEAKYDAGIWRKNCWTPPK